MWSGDGASAVYRSIVNGLPQVIWACDAQGQLEWVNDRWTEVTGLTLEASLDKRALDAVHPDDVEPLQAVWMKAFQTSSPCEIEYRIRTRDGAYRWHLARVTPLFDEAGAITRWLAAAIDIEERRQAAETLRTVEAALREADRRKDEFLALLSHELRNPLAPIITAAELMELRGDNGTPEERAVILRQARHALRLVDDLLDVSRVTRGKVTLEKRPLELAAVIASAVEATAPLFEGKRHRLTVAVDPEGLPVEGDELRLTQILSNLLTNAARYTPPGGGIELTAARAGAAIELRVRDNGDGIDAALLPDIFEMFVQGQRGIDRAGSGLGLGLALVRAFTELHGGTVSATSRGAGHGSEFCVRLPLDRRDRPSPPLVPPPRARVAAQVERILVVDDNRDAAGMVASLLTRVGHEVRVAFDAPAALELADAFRPQVAIVDLGLPVMDGYTLGRELRIRGAPPPVLVALTGYGRDQDRVRSQQAGFAFHLVKPVYLESLIALLDQLGAPA